MLKNILIKKPFNNFLQKRL